MIQFCTCLACCIPTYGHLNFLPAKTNNNICCCSHCFWNSLLHVCMSHLHCLGSKTESLEHFCVSVGILQSLPLELDGRKSPIDLRELFLITFLPLQSLYSRCTDKKRGWWVQSTVTHTFIEREDLGSNTCTANRYMVGVSYSTVYVTTGQTGHEQQELGCREESCSEQLAVFVLMEQDSLIW